MQGTTRSNERVIEQQQIQASWAQMLKKRSLQSRLLLLCRHRRIPFPPQRAVVIRRLVDLVPGRNVQSVVAQILARQHRQDFACCCAALSPAARPARCRIVLGDSVRLQANPNLSSGQPNRRRDQASVGTSSIHIRQVNREVEKIIRLWSRG